MGHSHPLWTSRSLLLSLSLERIDHFLADVALAHEIERDHHRHDDPERDLHLVAPHMAEQAQRRLTEAPADEGEEIRPCRGADEAADRIEPERHARGTAGQRKR